MLNKVCQEFRVEVKNATIIHTDPQDYKNGALPSLHESPVHIGNIIKVCGF